MGLWGTDPPDISRKGPPSLCRRVPSLWKELQGELFVLAAPDGDTTALHPSLWQFPTSQHSPRAVCGQREQSHESRWEHPKSSSSFQHLLGRHPRTSPSSQASKRKGLEEVRTKIKPSSRGE